MIAAMRKTTEDVVRRSVEDTRVAAVVIVMTAEDIRHPARGTCHRGILGDVQCDSNEHIYGLAA